MNVFLVVHFFSVKRTEFHEKITPELTKMFTS
jgi:hypothetical protein